MTCSYEIYVKIVLSIVACSGIILLSIGIWILASPIMTLFYYTRLDGTIVTDNFQTTLFIISSGFAITLGILLATVAVIGIFGNLQTTWIRRVVLFGSSLLLIFNIAGIAVLCFYDGIRVKYNVGGILYHYIETYDFDLSSAGFMDYVQIKFHCCGVYGNGDYPDYSAPFSCFSGNGYYENGCIDKIVTYIKVRWESLIAFFLICTLLQVLLITSMCLRRYHRSVCKTQHNDDGK